MNTVLSSRGFGTSSAVKIACGSDSFSSRMSAAVTVYTSPLFTQSCMSTEKPPPLIGRA